MEMREHISEREQVDVLGPERAFLYRHHPGEQGPERVEGVLGKLLERADVTPARDYHPPGER